MRLFALMAEPLCTEVVRVRTLTRALESQSRPDSCNSNEANQTARIESRTRLCLRVLTRRGAVQTLETYQPIRVLIVYKPWILTGSEASLRAPSVGPCDQRYFLQFPHVRLHL